MSDGDPVLLITGASSGIGAATARLLSGEGWRLILAARSIAELDALAEELGGSDRAVAVECDVAEWADQQAAVTVALEHFGRLDAAWANAGFGGQRSFLARHGRELARHGADERLRRGAHDSSDLARAEGVTGSPAVDRLRRRAPRDSRVALLRDQARGARDGRVGAAGARRDGRACDRDRPRDGRHAVLRRRCRSTCRSRPQTWPGPSCSRFRNRRTST